ncbi:alpha/beta hydrolase fold-domain-containing protein [Gorgonomyces haynaldii]|nr:alpha/beta hydrolase fold-domain-containing protein [Gorgonomyces haynaldii]
MFEFLNIQTDEIEYVPQKHDKIIRSFQQATNQEPLVPSKMRESQKVEFERQQVAIDFMQQRVDLSVDKTLGRIHGEWVQHDDPTQETVIYHIHGGVYLFGSPQMDRLISYFMSKYCAGRTFATSYRLAPQHQFPCAVIDTISGYLYLLEQKIDPQKIVLSGESAGGGLVLSTLLAIRDMNLPMPRAAVLFSPWVDLTMSSRSFEDNGKYDYLPELKNLISNTYAPPGYVRHPYVSPIYADLSGMPPILIQVGSCERLYDENVQLGVKLSQQNPNQRIELEIYQDQLHVFQMFSFLSVSKMAFKRAGDFIQKVTLDFPPKGFYITCITADARVNGFIPISKL